MLKEQEMFLNFILERVQAGKEATAKEILVAAFAKLATDEFKYPEFVAVSEQLLPLLEPRYQDEVTKAMARFGENLAH